MLLNVGLVGVKSMHLRAPWHSAGILSMSFRFNWLKQLQALLFISSIHCAFNRRCVLFMNWWTVLGLMTLLSHVVHIRLIAIICVARFLVRCVDIRLLIKFVNCVSEIISRLVVLFDTGRGNVSVGCNLGILVCVCLISIRLFVLGLLLFLFSLRVVECICVMQLLFVVGAVIMFDSLIGFADATCNVIRLGELNF